MTKKAKFDFAGSASAFMDTANKNTDTRWSAAEKIVAEKPSGLTPAALTVGTAPAVAVPPVAAGNTISELAHDVLNVEISRVRDNPRNARKLYDPLVVNERAASMRQDGQMTPAPACADWENPGGFILIGGHYRKKGLLQNGSTHIQIKLLPCKNLVELYRLSYAENYQRQSGTPLDDAMSWRELLDGGDVKSQEEIAAMINTNKATVNKTLALLSLSHPVLDILKQAPEKFNLTAGYELTVMASSGFTEPELIDLAKGIVAGEVSTRDLTALKKKKAQPPRQPKQFSRQHKIVMAGTSAGMIKDWDSGRVVLEVLFTDPQERERLVNELRARFNVSEPASTVDEGATNPSAVEKIVEP